MTLVYKTKLGFTLIELLVVLTISGTLIAFVGPVAFEQIDAAKAKSEIGVLKGIIRQASIDAYTEGKSIEIKLENKQISTIPQGKRTIFFNYLTFPLQTILFNRNGFSNQVAITYKYHDQLNSVNVYKILGYQNDEFIYAPE